MLKINLGDVNTNERGQKETNNFKNKVMVQESQYTSDGEFNSRVKKKKIQDPTAGATDPRQREKTPPQNKDD